MVYYRVRVVQLWVPGVGNAEIGWEVADLLVQRYFGNVGVAVNWLVVGWLEVLLAVAVGAGLYP